jgi:hypothetical protein
MPSFADNTRLATLLATLFGMGGGLMAPNALILLQRQCFEHLIHTQAKMWLRLVAMEDRSQASSS